MDFHLQQLSPPQIEPVTLDEAKEQCRIRHGQADTRLSRLIRSAREQVEGRTRRALIRQTWQQTQAGGAQCIQLQRWPVLEVTEVTVAGVPLDADQYRVRKGDGASVTLLAGPVCAEVVVTFAAGYGDGGEDIPESLRDWMLVRIADAYNNPGAVVIGTINSKLDFVDELLSQFIVPR
ncbi:phage head-tail connector protein [Pseudomonas sp.]|uniref:head-tail connector protein n=1 Tax=Pseudomonas sp. TaxID=306 RepID=UPI0029070708|nr:phage head-tail connector protein [Pseudomonas sp.]MDU4255576.1 phage head-tail connector protein [Pseudomonas sp.]